MDNQEHQNKLESFIKEFNADVTFQYSGSEGYSNPRLEISKLTDAIHITFDVLIGTQMEKVILEQSIYDPNFDSNCDIPIVANWLNSSEKEIENRFRKMGLLK